MKGKAGSELEIDGKETEGKANIFNVILTINSIETK